MNRLSTISIVIDDRTKTAPQVNELLSEYGEFITARLGLPHHRNDISIITLVMEADNDTIGALTGKIGQIDGVQVKTITI